MPPSKIRSLTAKSKYFFEALEISFKDHRGKNHLHSVLYTVKSVDVTTSSLEAYEYFLKGRDALGKMYFYDAKQPLKKMENYSSFYPGDTNP